MEEEEAIFSAIYDGNFGEVQRIVTEDPGCVHVIKGFGMNKPLDVAIAYNNPEIAQFLWDNGGTITDGLYDCGEEDESAVHKAVRHGRTAILKWLFAEDVLPLRLLNVKNRRGWTPLDVAVAYGKLETAQIPV